MTFQEAQEFLTRTADELPEEIYEGLNGGVILLPEMKLSPKSLNNDLYILGEYHNQPRGLGRYVALYYGSFERIFSRRSDSFWEDKLRSVLHHELVHHLESKAGDRSLERQDERDYAIYEERYYASREGTD